MNIQVLSIVCLTFLLACASETTQEEVNTAAEQTEISTKEEVVLRDTFDCEVYGKGEKNSGHWFPARELYIRMSTDKFTKTKEEATSYNVFQVYDTESCELLYNGKLSLVAGTNHPYKLQTDIYESVNQIVCTQGIDLVFCYHLGSRKHILPMNAQVPNEKLTMIPVDAPRDLALYGRYLFGWTKGIGIYGFNLTELGKPNNVAPVTTYSDAKTSYPVYRINLTGGTQFVIPETQSDKLTIKPLLEKPMQLGRRVVKAGSGNRYIILRTNTGNKPVVVDLKVQKVINLPSNIETSTVAVKSYLDGK